MATTTTSPERIMDELRQRCVTVFGTSLEKQHQVFVVYISSTFLLLLSREITSLRAICVGACFALLAQVVMMEKWKHSPPEAREERLHL
jgi:hypothetical protein